MSNPIVIDGATPEQQKIIDQVNKCVKTNGTPEQERIKLLILEKMLMGASK